jgi:hypothetical protein
MIDAGCSLVYLSVPRQNHVVDLENLHYGLV